MKGISFGFKNFGQFQSCVNVIGGVSRNCLAEVVFELFFQSFGYRFRYYGLQYDGFVYAHEVNFPIRGGHSANFSKMISHSRRLRRISIPAQKAGPFPATIIARISGSLFKDSKTAGASFHAGGFMAFFLSGLTLFSHAIHKKAYKICHRPSGKILIFE